MFIAVVVVAISVTIAVIINTVVTDFQGTHLVGKTILIITIGIFIAVIINAVIANFGVRTVWMIKAVEIVAIGKAVTVIVSAI